MATDRSHALAYTALVTVQLLFATLPVAGKVGLRELAPSVFVAFRVAGGALILLALQRLVHGPGLPALPDLGRLGVYAVFGVVLNQLLFIWGLNLSTAVNASLLLTIIPVFTYAIALVAGHETLDLRRAAGIVVALAGVLVLLDPRAFTLADGTLLGNLLILVNALSYAVYLVISRPILERIQPLVAISWIFVFGAVLVIPVALFEGGGLGGFALTPRTSLLMLYVIAGPTAAVYALNLFALKRVPSSTVAAFIYLQPVTGVLLAAWLLGEPIHGRTLVAGVLVFLGVALVTLGSSRATPAPPEPGPGPGNASDDTP